ncbi:inner centromere protein A isoform X2 [Sebastes umbrosus]|uniref:inner centromere protein A isoform X2 n=1 Tax=Sebastes umbrosus TaxID=72105 RepID=UPI00189ECBCA|nr:inner centromere protein A isoform X2 [Sebastes umbrosus]
MNSVQSSVRSLMQMFDSKAQEFANDITNVHMVWLEEIQQEANRMFSRDFNAEPELMPKTPSQKKNSRRKRVSMGYQEENQARRRFSKGKRSNLRGSSVKSLNFIAEEETAPEPSTSEDNTTTQSKRTTRKNKQTKAEVAEDVSQSHGSYETEEVQNKKPGLVEEEEMDKSNKANNAEDEPVYVCSTSNSPPTIPSPEIVVSISSSDQLSAECAQKLPPSPGRTAAKIAIAGAGQSSRRSSVRCSLKLRHSLAGLRHSMTQESVRRASRRSILKRKMARMGDSTCSSNIDEDSCMDSAEEEDREAILDAVSADTEDDAAAEELKEAIQINQSVQLSVGRVTRSVAANSASMGPPSLVTTEQTISTSNKRTDTEKQHTPQSGRKSRQSAKRKVPDTVEESPTKRQSPPKKSKSAIRPNMRTFLHTVQRNQMLMMTPNSLGRTAVMKSFIKHNTPLKVDQKSSNGIVTKERHKLEALKKKQEQEEERMKKMEEEKKKKQDELKRKRDERLRRVFDAKVKEEQRKDEEKKKKIEIQNDKRLAEEKAKKKTAVKRQEDLEQKRKLEEEAKRKKIQQAEEEKWQQELLAKKKADEEEQRARKLAEARRALEQKREQERERERELERERLAAAAEWERVEREKALALQREVEKAAREKERREVEEKRKELERKMEEQKKLAAEERAAKEREAAAKKAADAQAAACMNVTVDIERSVMGTPVGKVGGLNVTVDIEKSPQSYSITPNGNKPLSKSAEDYGMDQNSDDSTDDESAPRKPIPSWAEGHNLQQIIMKQYFNPPDLDSFFGTIEPPKLENIFYKSKPRYFKRTSSAVWHSPPVGNK